VCPLCGQSHPPKFHVFVSRSYRSSGRGVSGSVRIWVPRLICLVNKQLREKTGRLLQYTITILPGFLIPYSTILVDAVQDALESYIGKAAVTKQGAAMRMGCMSRLSFLLFYSRVVRRIEAWNNLLTELVSDLGGQIEQELVRGKAAGGKRVRRQWEWLHVLVGQYLWLHAQLPGAAVVLQQLQWQYIYALPAGRQTGMGP